MRYFANLSTEGEALGRPFDLTLLVDKSSGLNLNGTLGDMALSLDGDLPLRRVSLTLADTSQPFDLKAFVNVGPRLSLQGAGAWRGNALSVAGAYTPAAGTGQLRLALDDADLEARLKTSQNMRTITATLDAPQGLLGVAQRTKAEARVALGSAITLERLTASVGQNKARAERYRPAPNDPQRDADRTGRERSSCRATDKPEPGAARVELPPLAHPGQPHPEGRSQPEFPPGTCASRRQADAQPRGPQAETDEQPRLAGGAGLYREKRPRSKWHPCGDPDALGRTGRVWTSWPAHGGRRALPGRPCRPPRRPSKRRALARPDALGTPRGCCARRTACPELARRAPLTHGHTGPLGYADRSRNQRATEADRSR